MKITQCNHYRGTVNAMEIPVSPEKILEFYSDFRRTGKPDWSYFDRPLTPEEQLFLLSGFSLKDVEELKPLLQLESFSTLMKGEGGRSGGREDGIGEGLSLDPLDPFSIPQEVKAAARLLENFFKTRGIENWALGGVQSRVQVIECCCWGWETTNWFAEDGVHCSKDKTYWWYTRTSQLRIMVVRPGDSEPRFYISKDLPFEVVEASINQLITRHKSK